jgi:ribonuclease R
VLAVPVEDDRGGQRRTAKITAVVERANKTVTGAIERQGREVWLRPGSDRPPPHQGGGPYPLGQAGDKAAVAVTSYGNKKLPPMGTLREIFGKDGTRPAAVEAILYQYGIERAFPVSVQTAAELAPREVVPADLAGRLDLRGKTVITIDGASSKDFDDAVSLERDARGRWVLGVHIADVSHYVAEGSPLALEAWNRGTSVYFADQVVPMLPPELSNGIAP